MRRKITSYWLDPVVCREFREACALSGRKTCDVVEAWMKAFISLIAMKEFEGVEPCPWVPLNINIKTLKLESLYEKRGPKSKWSEHCPFDGHRIDSVKEVSYCLYVCRRGGRWEAIQNPDFSHLYEEELRDGQCAFYLKLR